MRRILVFGIALVACWVGAAPAQPMAGMLPESEAALQRGEWPVYAGTNAAMRWSPLDQIGPQNAAQLKVAWRWRSPDHALRAAGIKASQSFRHESTPVMIGGTLYTSTSLSQVAAIDAATGQTKWVFDPKVYDFGPHPANNGWGHRGVAYWREGDDERIIILTHYSMMYALDARTGMPVGGFGEKGAVDLTKGLRRPVSREYYDMQSPPLIIGNAIVVGSSVWDWWARRPPPPGDVRGFDARSGKLLWTFHTVPQGSEPGAETWENNSWREAGNTNVWTQMSADEQLGFVYLPVSTPTNDYYGGGRLGDNLYGESLVCIEAATGRRVWHYQIVRHGLWDYDMPAAPNLVDLMVNGQAVKAVTLATKQGFIFAFDRTNGRPLWPIEDRAVPPSTVRGERAATMQPFPTRPAAVDIQGIREDDLIDFTPELRQEAKEIIARYDSGPLYTPPTERGVIAMPGINGTTNWPGAAVDPETGMLYVGTQRQPYVIQLYRPSPSEGDHALIGRFFGLPGPQGLPLLKPPWASILAIDMNAGTHRWRRTLGRGPVNHPALRPLGIREPLGWSGTYNWALVTRTALFALQSGRLGNARPSPHGGKRIFDLYEQEPTLWVFDKMTGATIAEVAIGSNGAGSPITYMAGGKQHIVFPVGGGNVAEELVAVTLP